MTSWDEEVAEESNLNEPSYDVEVTVSDLVNHDTDNPLSSAKTFEDLKLSVLSFLVVSLSLAARIN